MRYGCNLWFAERGWNGLFSATFAVNMAGCLLAGFILVWLEHRGNQSNIWRQFWLVGFLGALTTFSALSLELWQLFKADRFIFAGGMIASQIFLGVVAIGFGTYLGRLSFN